jgi:hypothetical protein
MGSTNRNLKAYVRYDGSGRVVPGSLILRKQKPKVGKWTEIQGYECCNPNTTLVVNEPIILVSPIFEIRCNSNLVFSVGFSGTTYATIADFVAELSTNSSTSFLGTFIAGDTSITLNIKYDIAKGLCPNGILTMVITD